MSLFGSIQMAGNSLRANEIALQVVGQNIANANTPGYIREELVLKPAPTQQNGGLLLGMGVTVQSVVQKIDNFLEQRLRGSVSDTANHETTQQTYSQLEGILGELNSTDLSSSMNNFMSSVSEILNQPESRTVRNLAMLQGKTLSQDINRLQDRASSLRTDANKQIQDMAANINRDIEQIRVLNVRIAEKEGGDASASDAVGLRDQRLQALEDLSKMIDIRVVEQPSSGVAVYAGGDFLVYEGISREVEAVVDTDGKGSPVTNIHITGTDMRLDPTSGKLRGLLDSRDEVLAGFLDNLDSFAGTFIFEFNKLFSSGQGLTGYSQITSESAVADSTLALNAAGLPFAPQNGTFQVLIHNKTTGLTQTSDIRVNLDNPGQSDTTLQSLCVQLNQINGLKAEIDTNGRLQLTGQAQDQEFSFANDTSGVLAALGINTFFSGSSALDMGVNAAIQTDPSKFAASQGGIAADTKQAIELAAFLNRPLASQNGSTVTVLYSRIAGEVTQGSAISKSEAEGASAFELSLRGQKLSTSGVNLDEEAVRLISYQRAYQASAKYISTLSELFQLLVSL